MSELSKKLLNLINEELCINEICSILDLSHKQVYNILRGLKQIGMEFNKKYYCDGETVYVLKKDLSWMTKKSNVNIITEPNQDELSLMVISDLHLGSEFENIDAINKIYDYCAVNNIHCIIMAGDLLDGINVGRADSKKHDNAFDQIEYALSRYPFDKNILNFIVLGNHDVDCLMSYGVDFSTYLRNFRHDIVPLGYGHGRVNIKNDKIVITHPLGIGNNNNFELPNSYILIKGHHHYSKSIIANNGNCSITVPSLSNLFLHEDTFLPGATLLNIKFKNGYFDTIRIDNLLVNDRVNLVNSICYNMVLPKEKSDGIKNEEVFSKRKTLTK